MLSSIDRTHFARRLRAARARLLHVDPTEWVFSLLGEVDEALWRLRHEPSHFGRCDRCGHRIPRLRLELVPWTRYCRHDAA